MTTSMRPIAAILLAALIFCGCFVGFTVNSRADDSAPTLYVNDEVWYKTGIYPLKVYNSICVPISIFEQLEGITVTVNANNTAMIKRSENCYISFDFNRNSAISPYANNEKFYFKTYLEDGERYLPMLTVCTHLGLQHETYQSKIDQSVSVRISDGSQQKTFRELLERYNPGAVNAVTTPPATTETTAPLDPVENAVFLSVDGLDNADRIKALLDLCEEYAVHGAFFVAPEELESRSALVLSIIAGGHSIGFLVEREGAVEALTAANAALMARFKMTTRLVRITDADALTAEEDNALAVAGYSRWGSHIDLGRTEDAVRAALIAFRASLGEEGHIVLRVDPDGFNTVGYLREFFNSAQGKRLFFPITPAYYSPVN